MGNDWNAQNRERHLELQRQYRERVKREVFDAYGGCCSCCEEDNIKFLTIDHINNDGGQRRKSGEDGLGMQMYLRLRKRGYPLDYQVLCYNCNMGKGRYGGICPHEGDGDVYEAA